MPLKDSYLWPYVLTKRAQLSSKARSRSTKMGRDVRWMYPYTEEVQFRRFVKAALMLYVTIPMLEAAERGYERSLRTDSGSVLHLDDLNDLKGIIIRIALVAFPNSNFLNRIAHSISKQSRKQWSKFVKQATGVDITMFETEEEREFAAEWAEDNINRLKKYANLHAEKVNSIIATGVAEDKSWINIKKEIIKANAQVTIAQANYIARDATGNLNSGLQQVLSQEAGIEAYKWNTRRDRKVRGNPWGLYPKTKYSHYKMNGVLRRWSDGKISTDEGKTWRRVRGREEPEHVGRAPNCLPGDSEIGCFVDTVKLFRRKYIGNIITFITFLGDSIKVTPNHPVLTNTGWKAAKFVNIGDHVIKVTQEDSLFVTKTEPNNRKATIEEFFSFCKILGFNMIVETGGYFHGDAVIDENIDIINIKGELPIYKESSILKKLREFIFSKSDLFISEKSMLSQTSNHIGMFFPPHISNSFVCLFSEAYSFFFGSMIHSGVHTFAFISWLDSISDKIISQSTSSDIIFIRKIFNRFSRKKEFYKFLLREIYCIIRFSIMMDHFKPITSHMEREIISTDIKQFSNFIKISPLDIEFVSVIDKFSCEFSSHVYNLETESNWYTYKDYIIHNCRCTGEPFFLSLIKTVDKELDRKEKESKSLLERLGERGPRSGFSEWSD